MELQLHFNFCTITIFYYYVLRYFILFHFLHTFSNLM